MRILVAILISVLCFSSDASACDKLTRRMLDESLELGTRFLLANQRDAGNFHYAYDWRDKSDIEDDNQVRQAGATWGLALIHHDSGDRKVRRAAVKALRFFRKHSKLVEGRRFIVYPGARYGAVGTVALVALAHIELLRAQPDATLRKQLGEYLAMLASARGKGKYDDSGRPYGAPSPYYDGELLLAFVKAARYLGRKDLIPIALAEADAGHKRYVTEALAADPDSNLTKGYYQWSSMAYFELATWPTTQSEPRHATRLLHLADWMIDVHRTLRRTRNTGYAYEGIIPAWSVATPPQRPTRKEIPLHHRQGPPQAHPLANPPIPNQRPPSHRRRPKPPHRAPPPHRRRPTPDARRHPRPPPSPPLTAAPFAKAIRHPSPGNTALRPAATPAKPPVAEKHLPAELAKRHHATLRDATLPATLTKKHRTPSFTTRRCPAAPAKQHPLALRDATLTATVATRRCRPPSRKNTARRPSRRDAARRPGETTPTRPSRRDAARDATLPAFTKNTARRPSRPDADRHPARRDADRHPARRDADRHPARRDADRHPARRDADRHPARRDADRHPARRDADRHPARRDADRHPSRRDADRHPARRDADRHPRRKQTTRHHS